MSRAPIIDPAVREYLRRALIIAASGWVLFILIAPLGNLVFAAPTAALLRGLLAASGNTVAGTGPQIAVGEQAMRMVVPAWTAAPALLLGLGAVFAFPTDLAKKAMGAAMLVVNTVMVNVIVLGWLAVQTAVIVEGRSTVSFQDVFAGQLRWVYPPVMTGVLVLSLLFWMWRVVPRPLFGGRSAVAGE